MDEQVAIRTVCRVMIPFIQLFGLYVIAHGELGPGGGFQGGVTLASSIILYILIFDKEKGRQRISETAGALWNSTGILIFAAIGLLCIIGGGAYLEYGKLPLGSKDLAIHLGIYGIEIGVGITVALGMITIFFEMVGGEDD